MPVLKRSTAYLVRSGAAVRIALAEEVDPNGGARIWIVSTVAAEPEGKIRVLASRSFGPKEPERSAAAAMAHYGKLVAAVAFACQALPESDPFAQALGPRFD